MHEYNPAKTPRAQEWLALDEVTRLSLISDFHKRHGDFGESLEAHAGVHAVVETQLAMDVPNVRDALGRLRKSGLNRHDAVHAIGSVFAEHMFELMSDADSDLDEANERYYGRLKALSADS